ncbi:MAG: FliM/FliN family flagellar motor C-terminal domain-containing protein [Chlamydiales bacterium]
MKIEELLIDLLVIIGKCEMPIENYLALRKGDILLIDQRVEDSLIVKVSDESFFKGRPGLSETQKAVRINERIHT